MVKATIGQMAKKYGLTLRALRFYEDKGLISPERQGTKRLYDAIDEARIGRIVAWSAAGFSLLEIRQMLALWHSGRNSDLANFIDARLPQFKAEIEARAKAITSLAA